MREDAEKYWWKIISYQTKRQNSKFRFFRTSTSIFVFVIDLKTIIEIDFYPIDIKNIEI